MVAVPLESSRLSSETGELDVLSIEDLVARTTALVCGHLTRRKAIDVKHATAFRRLRSLGEPAKLAAAWADHRQQVPGTLDEASQEAARLLESRPELVVVERYSSEIVPCERSSVWTISPRGAGEDRRDTRVFLGACVRREHCDETAMNRC
jgi:hypothetical protein